MARKTVDTQAVHYSPDFDCGVCRFLLVEFGRQHFPGIESSKIIAWDAGPAPEGMTAEQWRYERGVLATDVGCGLLDNHNPQFKDMGVSSADLVAQAIARFQDPTLKNILDFCRIQDLEGKGFDTERKNYLSMITVLNQIRGWNLLYPDDPEKVVNLMVDAIRGIYAMEKDRLDAFSDFEEAEIREIELGGDGRLIRVARIVSESTKADDASRMGGPENDPKRRCSVAIVYNPRRKWTRIISTRDIDLTAVYLRLVIMEAMYTKTDLVNNNIERLTQLGSVPEVDHIYFAKSNLILNGSFTRPHAKTMEIYPNRQMDVVCAALELRVPAGMECAGDKPCVKQDCLFFDLRLDACHEYRDQRYRDFLKRKEQKEAEEAAAKKKAPVVPIEELKHRKEASEA